MLRSLRIISVSIFSIVSLLALTVARAAADDDAAAVVESLHGTLVEVAGIEPALRLEQRIERLTSVLDGSHDLSTMARVSVGRRYWRAWSDDERSRYVEVFRRFSIATYASRFASIRAGQFEILGSEILGDDRVEVNGVLHRVDSDAPDVTMDYTLRRSDDRWQIVNIVADGVSELGLMSARHFEILESGGIDDLIADLEAQIVELHQAPA